MQLNNFLLDIPMGICIIDCVSDIVYLCTVFLFGNKFCMKISVAKPVK